MLVYRQEDLGLRRFFAAGAPAEEELQQVAGLVPAAAGRRASRTASTSRTSARRPAAAATPLARDLNLLEQVAAVVLDEEGAAHPADGRAPTRARPPRPPASWPSTTSGSTRAGSR